MVKTLVRNKVKHTPQLQDHLFGFARFPNERLLRRIWQYQLDSYSPCRGYAVMFSNPCTSYSIQSLWDEPHASSCWYPLENFQAWCLDEYNFGCGGPIFFESILFNIYHLVNKHDRGLERKCFPAYFKQILQGRAQHVHHKLIILVFGPVPVYFSEAVDIIHLLQDLILDDQLRIFRFLVLLSY